MDKTTDLRLPWEEEIDTAGKVKRREGRGREKLRGRGGEAEAEAEAEEKEVTTKAVEWTVPKGRKLALSGHTGSSDYSATRFEFTRGCVWLYSVPQ
jgi:hypothetical protein